MQKKNSKVARTRLGDWKKVFLENVASGGQVHKSAEAAGVAFTTAWRLKKRDKKFARAWRTALRQSTQALEDEAIRRAVDGVNEPIYQGGKLVGAVKKYSDTLLIFMLKGRKPKTYRDRMHVEINARDVITRKAQELGLTPEQIGSNPALAAIFAKLGIGGDSNSGDGSAGKAAEC